MKRLISFGLCITALLFIGLHAQALPGHAAATAQSAPASRPPQRLALLVGVGNYFQRAARPPLRAWPKLSVEVELREYAEVLARHYDFARADIQILLNEQASKQGIHGAFQHMIQTAQPGDTVLFHFSGHGQRLPDDAVEPDEPDGLDESLVTYDATDQSAATGERANIRDDELARWLVQLSDRMRPAPGQPVRGNITVTLDSCFSGSATRGAWTPRGRNWDPTQDGLLPPPRMQQRGVGGASSGNPFNEEEQKGSLRAINILTAARADQVAWERDGRGVFTSAWVRFLAQSHRAQTPTYHAAAQHLAIDLHAQAANQDPQTLGDGARQIFLSTVQSGQPRDLHVFRDAHNQLWLPAGDVHGVTIASRYALYPADALVLNQTTQQGEAVVAEIQPWEARLRLLGYPARSSSTPLVAVEVQHAYAPSPLRVLLENFHQRPELEDCIRQLGTVQVVSTRRGQLATSVDYDLRLRYDDTAQRIELLRSTAHSPHDLVVIPSAAVAPQPSALASVLLREWRWRHFARLRQPDPAACIELEVVPLSRPVAADKNVAHLEMAHGETFALRLHNRSDKPLYGAVLGLSPDGDIDLLVGDEPGKNRVVPGRSWGLSQKYWKLAGKPGERVLLKVIATDEFVDFSPAESIHLRAGTRGAAPTAGPGTTNPLLLLLQGPQVGQAPATVRGGGQLVPATWGTTDGSITIR